MGCTINLPVSNEYEQKTITYEHKQKIITDKYEQKTIIDECEQKPITIENLNQFTKECLINHVQNTNILSIICAYTNTNIYDTKIINYLNQFGLFDNKNYNGTGIFVNIFRECIEYAIQINHITLFDQIFEEISRDFNQLFFTEKHIYWNDYYLYVGARIKIENVIIQCINLCRIELINIIMKRRLYYPAKNIMKMLEWIRNNIIVKYLTDQNLKIRHVDEYKLTIKSVYEFALKHGYNTDLYIDNPNLIGFFRHDPKLIGFFRHDARLLMRLF